MIKKSEQKKVIDLLKEMNNKVHENPNNALSKEETEQYRQKYDTLLQEAQKESPPPDESTRKAGQRGRLQKNKIQSLT